MNAFTYSYPVKVYFGEKAAEKHLKNELAKVGANVLLAYGGGSMSFTMFCWSAVHHNDSDDVRR